MSEREMTLQEWVERLPEIHAARREYDAHAAESAALRKDAERLDWLERWITDNSGGFEIYPIGPDEEYGPDGNTVIGVTSWTLADKQWPVSTMREAIDLAMQADGERENERE